MDIFFSSAAKLAQRLGSSSLAHSRLMQVRMYEEGTYCSKMKFQMQFAC